MLGTGIQLVVLLLLSAAGIFARPGDGEVLKRQKRFGNTALFCSLVCESVEVPSDEDSCELLDIIDGTQLCKSLCSAEMPPKKTVKKPAPTTPKSPGGSAPSSGLVTPTPNSPDPSAQSGGSSLAPLGASSTTDNSVTGGTGSTTSNGASTGTGTATTGSSTEPTKTREAPLSESGKARLQQYLPQMVDFWCDWKELFPSAESEVARAKLCQLRTGPINATRLNPPALLNLIQSDR